MATRETATVLVAICLVLGCQPAPSPAQTEAPTVALSSLATSSPTPIAGGCGPTQVFRGPGPDAASGLASNPWAVATPADAGVVAYFWHEPPALVSVAQNGQGSKVLWVSHIEQAASLSVVAHPMGASSPRLEFIFPVAVSPKGNYPSEVVLPSPGCWQLDVTVGYTTATVDMDVAPLR